MVGKVDSNYKFKHEGESVPNSKVATNASLLSPTLLPNDKRSEAPANSSCHDNQPNPLTSSSVSFSLLNSPDTGLSEQVEEPASEPLSS